jgi:hypothetical protein
MANYYCKYCGLRSSTVSSLTGNSCLRHPFGAYNGNHVLYEGREKKIYTCKYCGLKSEKLSHLISADCLRHPNGTYEGKHEAAL